MPNREWTDKSYYDFRRGIVSNYDAMHIPENAVADANNVLFRRLGSIKKRLGYTPVGSEMPTGSSGVMGLHAYYGEGIKEFLAVVNTNLYFWDDPDWTSITSSLTANKRTEFANALNKCIIVNGENTPLKLEGTSSLSTLGTGTAPDNWRPNKSAFIKWRHNVLWFGNITEKDDTKEMSRVRQSEIRTIEGDDAYPWTFYYDSEADADVKGITGIHPFRNNLVIMKEKRTAMITGTSREDYGIFNYDNSLGSIAHRSMQEYQDKLFYLGTKGIYAFDGVYNTKYSDAIDDLMASLNEENLYKGASIKWDNKYFLSTQKDNTYSDTIIVFDGELGSFTKFTGINASCFSTYLTGNDTYLYFGESNTGKVYQLFEGSAGDITHDNTANITASFTTKKYFTGDPNYINDIRHLWVEAKGHSSDTLTIKYRFDQNATYSSGWTFNLSNRFQRFVFPEGSYGRLIQFKVTNSSLLTPFEFFGFTISQRPRRRFS